MFCDKCGKIITESAKFCKYCGNELCVDVTESKIEPEVDDNLKKVVSKLERIRERESYYDRVFALIEKAGGEKLPHFGNLTFNEKVRIRFNGGTLFFGWLHYLWKGMWRKVLSYCGIFLLVMFFAEEFLKNTDIPNDSIERICSFAFMIFLCFNANIFIYRKEKLGDNSWF